jgi:hypothetical protein
MWTGGSSAEILGWYGAFILAPPECPMREVGRDPRQSQTSGMATPGTIMAGATRIALGNRPHPGKRIQY